MPVRSVLLMLVSCLVAATLTHGASQRALSLEEMVGYSDEIVVGRIASAESRWQGRLIVTVATVEIEEALKGGRSQRLDVTQLGGTAVHPRTGLSVTMSASTQVTLEPGTDVLLFVSRAASGQRQLVGAQQGVFRIRENPRTRVREIPVGPKRLTTERGAERDTVRSEAQTLDAMRERIRTVVDRESANPARSERR